VNVKNEIQKIEKKDTIMEKDTGMEKTFMATNLKTIRQD
jgi:hypothetical protein